MKKNNKSKKIFIFFDLILASICSLCYIINKERKKYKFQEVQYHETRKFLVYIGGS